MQGAKWGARPAKLSLDDLKAAKALLGDPTITGRRCRQAPSAFRQRRCIDTCQQRVLPWRRTRDDRRAGKSANSIESLCNHAPKTIYVCGFLLNGGCQFMAVVLDCIPFRQIDWRLI